MAFDKGSTTSSICICRRSSLVITFLLVRSRVLHRNALESVKSIAKGLADRTRDKHHRRARRRHAGDALPVIVLAPAFLSRTTSQVSTASASP